jgi:hypothetical protein
MIMKTLRPVWNESFFLDVMNATARGCVCAGSADAQIAIAAALLGMLSSVRSIAAAAAAVAAAAAAAPAARVCDASCSATAVAFSGSPLSRWPVS